MNRKLSSFIAIGLALSCGSPSPVEDVVPKSDAVLIKLFNLLQEGRREKFILSNDSEAEQLRLIAGKAKAASVPGAGIPFILIRIDNGVRSEGWIRKRAVHYSKLEKDAKPLIVGLELGAALTYVGINIDYEFYYDENVGQFSFGYMTLYRHSVREEDARASGAGCNRCQVKTKKGGDPHPHLSSNNEI